MLKCSGRQSSTAAQIKTPYNQAGRRTALGHLSFLVQGVLVEDQLSCKRSQRRRMFLCSIRTSLHTHSSSLCLTRERDEDVRKRNYEWDNITSGKKPQRRPFIRWVTRTSSALVRKERLIISILYLVFHLLKVHYVVLGDAILIRGERSSRHNKLNKQLSLFSQLNKQTDLKGQHKFTLFHFVYIWQTLPPF